MRSLTLGRTGITVPQNAFGALPIQRVSDEEACRLLMRAFEGGMRYFDTARAYSDSEHKLGLVFGDASGLREQVIIASKTMAKDPEGFWADLETSLEQLQTSYIDIYQFHCVEQVWAPGDGSGMYECMLQAREKGLIRHIGATAHKIGVAEDLVASGLYETLQFPFSYLLGEREERLCRMAADADMGFICMKGLAGGLITDAEAAMAYVLQFPALPIWGIQRESELDDWLALMDAEPRIDEKIQAIIDADRAELSGEFCRGCGYCQPCPQDILIQQCARMSLMLRRAPGDYWLGPEMQAEMAKIENCINCRVCTTRCPYELSIPELLQRNYADYQAVLAGDVQV